MPLRLRHLQTSVEIFSCGRSLAWQESRESGPGGPFQMERGDTAVKRAERCQISERLGIRDGAEGELLSGNGGVFGVSRGKLQEKSAVWSTFMQLAGGMEKTRAITEGGGQVIP